MYYGLAQDIAQIFAAEGTNDLTVMDVADLLQQRMQEALRLMGCPEDVVVMTATWDEENKRNDAEGA